MRTYNVTSRCVHATIFAEEKRSVLQILSVCVALSIQHAMRMRHIVICGVYSCAIFFHTTLFYVMPTHCIYVFCLDLRTNSDLCHLQHKLIGFYNRDLTLYSPVVTICTTSLTFNNSTFCPHSVFMCFVWISEQTAIISLYNIN